MSERSQSVARPGLSRIGAVREPVSKARQAAVFVVVLVVGFAMFAIPAILLQVGFAGGYGGTNLALLGVVQLVLVVAVVRVGLRWLHRSWSDIGATVASWRSDAALGAVVASGWLLVQFGWLFDATGGASRPDIAGILALVDGSWWNVLWYVALGVLGGGVAEEIYNRGFVITVLEDLLGSTRAATIAAGAFSVLFFAAGHLPGGWVDWVDILVPSIAYVVLFVVTRRLTAPMVAHSLWNGFAVVGIHIVYG